MKYILLSLLYEWRKASKRLVGSRSHKLVKVTQLCSNRPRSAWLQSPHFCFPGSTLLLVISEADTPIYFLFCGTDASSPFQIQKDKNNQYGSPETMKFVCSTNLATRILPLKTKSSTLAWYPVSISQMWAMTELASYWASPQAISGLQFFDIWNSTLGCLGCHKQELAYGHGTPSRSRRHGMKGSELPPDMRWIRKGWGEKSIAPFSYFSNEHQGATINGRFLYNRGKRKTRKEKMREFITNMFH